MLRKKKIASLLTTSAFALFTLHACQSKPKQEAATENPALLASGQITLSPALRDKADPLAVLFVIARTPDNRIGAVKKMLPPFQFPVSFELNRSDQMIQGTDLPVKLQLSARLDKDGNANPAESGDIVGFSKPKEIAVGSKKIEINLEELLP